MRLYHTSNMEIQHPDINFSGIYNREQTLNQLRYKYPNHQLCISNQLVIDKHLHFIKSIKL